MNKLENFDVVIVYNGKDSSAASDLNYKGRSPFAKNSYCYSYNVSYQFFLEYCKKVGLRAAFASTNDVSADGTFKAVWIYDNNWKRLRHPASTKLIYDKFSYTERHNRKYSMRPAANPQWPKFFHDSKIREIFYNKYKCFKEFPEVSIPTVQIDLRSKKTIDVAKKKLRLMLKKHKYSEDFGDSFVAKATFGAGGSNVFKVDDTKDLLEIGKNYGAIPYILQPYIEASGFKFGKHEGTMDLRVIVCNGVIKQCYIRIPKQGDFRANAAKGGNIAYLTSREIPADVKKMTKAINKKLPIKNGFYALDFIKSAAGHLYFIEGNITPGLNWYTDAGAVRGKELMRTIIKSIKLAK